MWNKAFIIGVYCLVLAVTLFPGDIALFFQQGSHIKFTLHSCYGISKNDLGWISIHTHTHVYIWIWYIIHTYYWYVEPICGHKDLAKITFIWLTQICLKVILELERRQICHKYDSHAYWIWICTLSVGCEWWICVTDQPCCANDRSIVYADINRSTIDRAAWAMDFVYIKYR